MRHLIATLSSLIQPPHAAAADAAAGEPLDHPCLVAASHAFIDDLPLPAFSVAQDGGITLVALR